MLRKTLLCTLIIIFLSPITVSQAKTTLQLTVNAATNVYAEADDLSSVIGQIKPGDSVAITGRSALNYYYQIDFSGQVGWVSADSDTINCPYAQHIADICPDSHKTVTVDYQLFEHGIMLWFKDTKDIFVLSTSDVEWGGWFFDSLDNWSGEALTQLTPPSGLFQPQMGFGKLWLNDAMMVRQHLGWATAPERSYITTLELYARTPAGTFEYLRLPPAAQVFHLRRQQVIKVSYYETMWAILGHDM